MRKRDRGGDPPSQHTRFLETACALGVDEDPAAFRAALGAVGRHKPRGEVPEPPPEPAPEKAVSGRRKRV